MKHIKILFTVVFLGFFTTSVLAQVASEKEDPFKTDPFFSKSLYEFFQQDSSGEHNRDTVQNIKHYVDRLNDNGLDFDSGFEAGPYNSNPLYGIFPSLPMIHFNRVNGVFLGLRKERMQWYNRDWLFGIEGIQPHGLLGYSFGQNEWQYVAGLEKFIGWKKHLMLGGEFHRATSTDDFWRVGLNETSITSFFAGFDYMDYYRQEGYGFYLITRSDRLFEGGIAYKNDSYQSLNRETTFALFGSNSNYRVNPPVDFGNGTPETEVDIESIFLSAAFNPKKMTIARRFTFSASGMVEFADLGRSDADYAFNKYTGEVSLFVNFERGGLFKYRLRTGSITGTAPALRLFELGGIGTLRAQPFKSMAGNQMILSNAEIHYGSTRGNSEDWIDFDDMTLMLFLDSGWTHFSSELRNGKSPFNGYSDFSVGKLNHSGGIGAGTSLVRAELAWNLNNMDQAPVLWIRFNPTF